jgi:gas vesicle protein
MTTSAELQREAEVTRAGLSSTLEELRDSMTRGALTSGASALAKESGATLARAAVRRASDNPLAALLIGAGVVMLFSRANGPSMTGGLVERATRAIKGSAGHTVDATTAVRGTTGQVQQAVSDTAGKVKQAVGDTASQVQQTIHDTTGQVQQKAGEFRDKARQLTNDVLSGTTDRASGLMQEQPILVTALAVAVGAALGAALPVSETERRYLGPAAARATTKGHEVAEHVADAVSGNAEEMASVATEAIASEVLGDARRPG